MLDLTKYMYALNSFDFCSDINSNTIMANLQIRSWSSEKSVQEWKGVADEEWRLCKAVI